MRRGFYILTLAELFGLFAFAQEGTPGPDVFVGYSFVRVNSTEQSPAFNAHGGLAVVGFNYNHHFAIEFEFGGYHTGNVNNVRLDTTSFSFAVGPRLSYGRTKAFDPYVHALFGLNRLSTTIANNSLSQSQYAIPIGGGIDIKITKYIVFRPIQFDYYLTGFETPAFLISNTSPQTANKNQQNIRWAAGIVFTFGIE